MLIDQITPDQQEPCLWSERGEFGFSLKVGGGGCFMPLLIGRLCFSTTLMRHEYLTEVPFHHPSIVPPTHFTRPPIDLPFPRQPIHPLGCCPVTTYRHGTVRLSAVLVEIYQRNPISWICVTFGLNVEIGIRAKDTGIYSVWLLCLLLRLR